MEMRPEQKLVPMRRPLEKQLPTSNGINGGFGFGARALTGSGATNATVTGTLGGTPGSTMDNVAFYNRNAGSGPLYDAFLNSLQIIGS